MKISEKLKNSENNENNEEEKVEEKIAKPIAMVRDVLKKLDINEENSKFPRQVLKRFAHIVEKKVSDPRSQNKIMYPVPYLLLISFLALLSGAETWVDIELFAKAERKSLKRILPKYYGTPSHDTYRRVFGLLAVEELAQTITNFLVESLQMIKKALRVKDEGYRLINVDGKEARSTGRKYNSDEKIRNLHTLNIYDASNAICLNSVPIDSKSNEIPVAERILSQMQLKNTVVTFDALNTQKKTIAGICKNNGDYVGGLKGNQHLFYNEVVLYFTDDVLAKIQAKGADFYTYTEKAHNRIEKRSFYLTKDIKWFTDIGMWANLKSFVCYILQTEDLVTGKKTIERHY